MQGLNGRKPGEHMLFKDPIVRLACVGENGSSREERAPVSYTHLERVRRHAVDGQADIFGRITDNPPAEGKKQEGEPAEYRKRP